MLAGMPRELLRLTEESDEAGRAAVAAGADKVFFTGSSESGRAVMRALAETGTPSVMELSGCSAVVVLPGSDLGRVCAAVVFGIRLNGSATCMAPRRLLVMGKTRARREALVNRLQEGLAGVAPVELEEGLQMRLRLLVKEAVEQGATLVGVLAEMGVHQPPILLVNARPEMTVAKVDLFAPVLSVIDVDNAAELAVAQRACPLALSVSVFGEELLARRLADRMTVGTVMINDVIVPYRRPADPLRWPPAAAASVSPGVRKVCWR